MRDVKFLNTHSSVVTASSGPATEFQISFKAADHLEFKYLRSKKLEWDSKKCDLWFEIHGSVPYILKVVLKSLCEGYTFRVYCSTTIVNGNGTLCHPIVECCSYRKDKPKNIYTLDQEFECCKFNCYSIDETDAIPFIRDGRITLQCTLMIIKRNTIFANDSKVVSNRIAVSDDLLRMYESQQHADITLIVGDDKLLAHKSVLCARSPVFAKMFEHEMLEKKESCMKITDIEFSILEEMISYLYSGEIKNMSFDTAYSLYSVAAKYAMSGLRHLCSCFLKSSLTFNDVCCVLCLADLHNDKELSMASKKFILDNFKDIIGSTGWLTMLKNETDLANEVLKNYVLSSK